MSQDPERFRETLGAPDRLDTRLGALTFADGVPSDETAERVYDHLDFLHGVNAYLNSFAGASTYAIRNGFHEVGVEDNSVLLFSELLGSESVFLTANADTVYFLGFIDLTSGPMVVETPPMALGAFDDMWWGWIIDFGLPGPDRGEGGRFLLVPHGLRRPAAGQRLPRRSFADDEGAHGGPVLPDERRPGADRRDDQAHDEDLPLRARWSGHERRDDARRR